jgi:hypothetical protein
MNGLLFKCLSSAVVRANPNYRFRPFAELTEEEALFISKTSAADDFVGVLIGADSINLNIKAVSPHVATLFKKANAPQPVDSLITDLPECERDEIVVRLILEGILQISANGIFLDQGAAHSLVIECEQNIIGNDHISRLSVNAIKHGQHLGLRNPEKLAARLYFYHRYPTTPGWLELWPHARGVLDYFALTQSAPLGNELGRSFVISTRALESTEWLSWHRRGLPPKHSKQNKCKLYVSPSPASLRDAVMEVVALLPDSLATNFKMGASAYGLLRPDKLMIYFDNYNDMFDFAESLLPRIVGLSVQGVPFSASLDQSGILSWGIDPAEKEIGFGFHVDDSWRIWICNRLAAALTDAFDTVSSPWIYALTKIWLAGIDTRTWTHREFLTRG